MITLNHFFQSLLNYFSPLDNFFELQIYHPPSSMVSSGKPGKPGDKIPVAIRSRVKEEKSNPPFQKS